MNGEIAIAWAELTYNVRPYCFGAQKTILSRLYGSVVFGTIIALMGPSGSGKTTLLKCLNGKLSSGLDRKSKLFTNSDHKLRTCFVSQHDSDHLIMSLTAKQNLIYASKLKNSDDKNIPEEFTHENNAMNVLNELSIEDICDTRVDKCSGGELKRLSIAMALIKVIKPNVLCIDEPTTGLDSNVAQNVMHCLTNLCKTHGIAVITSIHQPNNEIIASFDRLYVLSKCGECVFDGHPDNISTHLDDCDIVCNEHQVPIEQLLKLASIENKNQYIEALITKTRHSLKRSVVNKIQNRVNLCEKGIEFRCKSFKAIDVWHIVRRSIDMYVSQWTVIFYQFIYYLTLSIIMTQLFDADIGKPDTCFNPHTLSNKTCLKVLEDDSLVYQNQNFIFLVSSMTLFSHLCITAVSYISDVKMFFNEHQNCEQFLLYKFRGLYSTGAFFIGKTLVELFPTTLYAITLSFPSYYMSGQLFEAQRVIPFILLIMFGFYTSEGISYNIAILFIRYEQIAPVLSICVMGTAIVFCNFFILVKKMSQIMQTMSEFVYMKWIINSGLLLIYGQNRCTTDELSTIMLKYDINDSQLWSNFHKLIAFSLLLRMTAFVMLLMKTKAFAIDMKCRQKSSNDWLSSISIRNKTVFCHKETRNKRRLSSIVCQFMHSIPIDSNDVNTCERRVYELNDNCNNNHIIIAWNDLTLRISKRFLVNEKTILRQLNGFFEFGTLNALMGSSGAGKTSLLKCINGLYGQYLSDETNILLNRFRKIKSCFIVQNERQHLLWGLTAKQSLIYSSKMKNTDNDFDHEMNVNVLMSELLISNIVDTNVELCSGGEQKRLVIAMELTSRLKPNLICIDEPTSGLDSNATQVVIECLKRVSYNHNICVITSIHQPNNDVLIMFDRLYVLAKGGQCVYAGPPQHLSQHLSECGIEYTQKQIPIEVLLKECNNRLNDINVHKLVQKTAINEKDIIERADELIVFPDGVQQLCKRFQLRDLRIFLLRNILYTYRYYWKILLFQSIVYIVFGVVMQMFFSGDVTQPSGCVSYEDDFNNTCAKTEATLAEEELLQMNLKYIFFCVIVLYFFVTLLTTMSFNNDLNVFFNEHRNNWYSTGVYYCSKTIVELLITIITITIYSYAINKYTTKMFVYYFLYLTTGALIIQSLSHILSILLADNQRLAIFVCVGAYIVMMLFSNTYILTNKLHYVLRGLSRLSTLKLIIECILTIIYGFERCGDREFSTVLYMFGVDDSDYYTNTQLLIIQLFAFRFAALIALVLKVNPILNSRNMTFIRRRAVRSLAHYKAYIPGLNSEYEFRVKHVTRV